MEIIPRFYLIGGCDAMIPVLALVGGIAGSIGGDAFAKWVADITYVEE